MTNLKAAAQQQLEWLKNLIFTNGEFVLNNTPSNNAYKIVPYFSNIAGLALLEDPNNCSLIKNYLKWYISHMNLKDKFGAVGTIYDYYLKTDGSLISTDDYDSNDSYPATFFSLCLKYFTVSNDYKFFITNKNKFDLVLDSMLSTFDIDYLTWAKPNYKIKYLMDNCEVFRGLQDSYILYKNVFDDNERCQTIKSHSEKNFNAMQSKMWNKEYYYYLIDEKDNKSIPNFNKFYPDASSQLFPILSGVINHNSIESKKIYQNFCKYFPDINSIQKQDDFPNCYISYICYLMKDYSRSLQFSDFYYDKYIKNQNKWPWYSVESSYFIRTIFGMENS